MIGSENFVAFSNKLDIEPASIYSMMICSSPYLKNAP